MVIGTLPLEVFGCHGKKTWVRALSLFYVMSSSGRCAIGRTVQSSIHQLLRNQSCKKNVSDAHHICSMFLGCYCKTEIAFLLKTESKENSISDNLLEPRDVKDGWNVVSIHEDSSSYRYMNSPNKDLQFIHFFEMLVISSLSVPIQKP